MWKVVTKSAVVDVPSDDFFFVEVEHFFLIGTDFFATANSARKCALHCASSGFITTLEAWVFLLGGATFSSNSRRSTFTQNICYFEAGENEDTRFLYPL